MVFITGDTHGSFNRIKQFCQEQRTTYDDTMIILGDAGINYWGDYRDKKLKESISRIPITLFCIHGNHELRPENLTTYYQMEYFNNGVWSERGFDNIHFAKDGVYYEIESKQCFVIGGAYSVDKFFRLRRRMNWFDDEQPSEQIKKHTEWNLEISGNQTDIMLTHTCPFKYIPTEVFLPMIDQSTVDNSTEQWLDKIEETVSYNKWYCGHYHTDKTIDKMRFMFNDIIEFK